MTELNTDPIWLLYVKYAALKYAYHWILEIGVLFRMIVVIFTVSLLVIILKSSVYFYVHIPL